MLIGGLPLALLPGSAPVLGLDITVAGSLVGSPALEVVSLHTVL